MKSSIDDLLELLKNVEKIRPKESDGLGIILYENTLDLPITTLMAPNKAINLPLTKNNEILNLLLKLCDTNHPNHDGFHLLSKEFILTHVSQYFATPIVNNVSVEFEYGSRYRTAFYGSFLKNVIACGVLSENYGPTIFVKGKVLR